MLINLINFRLSCEHITVPVEGALAHPYLNSLHDISDEPISTSPFNFDFEQHALTEEQMKELIYRESLAFNPEYQQMCWIVIIHHFIVVCLLKVSCIYWSHLESWLLERLAKLKTLHVFFFSLYKLWARIYSVGVLKSEGIRWWWYMYTMDFCLPSYQYINRTFIFRRFILISCTGACEVWQSIFSHFIHCVCDCVKIIIDRNTYRNWGFDGINRTRVRSHGIALRYNKIRALN